MIQSDVQAHPPDEPPEDPEEARERDEAVAEMYRGADEVCFRMATESLVQAKAEPCPWCNAHDDEVGALLEDYRDAVRSWGPRDSTTSTRLGQAEHRIHAAFLRRGETVGQFWSLAAAELARARQAYPGRQSCLHHGYAVLLEEVDELWEAIKSRRQDRDPHHLLVEAIQVAAMACRLVEDRGLLVAVDMPSAGGAGDILEVLRLRAEGKTVVWDSGEE